MAIKFSELDRWALERQALVNSAPSGWRIVKLRQLLRQKQDKVTVKNDTSYRLYGVKWYGEGVFERETCLGAEVSASYLYPLRGGCLIYNRLFAWKASFAVVPENAGSAYVSNEFPQFEVDKQQAHPQYVLLYCLSAPFVEAVKKASEGSAAVSRNRFKEASFLDFEMPLPPLNIQHAIVTQWEQAQAEVQRAEARAAECEAQAQADFLAALGLSVSAQPQARRRVFAVNWSSMERWGVDQCRLSMSGITQSAYPSVPLGTLAKIGSGGTPSRRIPTYYEQGNIPWVKTTEVRDALIEETEEKITEAGLENSSAKIYPAGSLIIAMYGQGATRARTGKLAIKAATNQACCVLHEINSQVEIDFLWFFLMSQYEPLRALASGNNQPNLNAGMIANYPIPVPPLDIQKALVEAISQARTEAAQLRQQAAQLREQARRKLERALLGAPSDENS